MSTEIPSLYASYANSFKIGAAVHTRMLKTEGEFIAKHYNSVTAENQMKFEEVHPREHEYTFEAADEIVDFAVARAIGVRGHTLVWHNQTPSWVFEDASGGPASRELMLSRLKQHIDTVVGRYKGQIYAWDVVNEAIEDKTDLIMRDTKWLRLLGRIIWFRHLIWLMKQTPMLCCSTMIIMRRTRSNGRKSIIWFVLYWIRALLSTVLVCRGTGIFTVHLSRRFGKRLSVTLHWMCSFM